MNYAEARALSDKSGWHYTIRNDDNVWTHECCREQVPATEQDVRETEWIYHGSLKVGDLINGPPHPAHPTRAEAEECFHQWRLAEIKATVEFSDDVFGDWTGCEAPVGEPGAEKPCDAPTKGGARYHDDRHPDQVALCPDHRTEEIVLAQVGRVTSSMYS